MATAVYIKLIMSWPLSFRRFS